MREKSLIIICIFSSVLNVAFSQTFQRSFGNTGSETGTCIKSTADGNYIISGITSSFSNGYEDAYLLKMDSGGNILWSKAYGGTYKDRGYYVSTCSDGGYILTGYTSVQSAGNYLDLYLVRTDSDGNLSWSRSAGGTNDDFGWYVMEANDGGFLTVGSSKSFNTGNWDGYVVKTDAAGALQWTKVIGGSNYDSFNGMNKTNDGGYIITGVTSTNSFGNTDIWLIKLNSAGDTLWTRQYGKATEDAGNAVIQTDDGGYLITGDIHISLGAAHHNACLLKTDGSGNLQWVKTYGSNPGAEIAWDVRQTTDNGYLFAGASSYYGNGNGDILIVKTDTAGNILWSKTYGNTAFDDFWYSQQTPDEGNMMVGSTSGGGQNIFLVMTDSLGNSSCNTTIATPIVNIPVLQVRSGTNVITGGTLNTPNTLSFNAPTINNNPCITVAVAEEEKMDQPVLIYPNPFSETAVIRVAEIDHHPITLKLFNVFGQEVYPNLIQKDYGFIIHKGNLSNGIYFYNLASSEKSVSMGKIVIQ